MSLYFDQEGWFYKSCATCGADVDTIFWFDMSHRQTKWAVHIVCYLRCTLCSQLYVGEYSEGIVSGRCWSRNPIDKIHQIEGFIGEAYWMYSTDSTGEGINAQV